MKKALFMLFILALCLLAGCGSREALEPTPAWPDRVEGEYDDTVRFFYRDAEPAQAGADSLTGRMTALFPTEDGTLALGWRQITGGEAELLEDFLEGNGGTVGVWAEDDSGPGAAESYVYLQNRWYCLTASCPELTAAELLPLLDGTVTARSGEERVSPRLTGEPWYAALPWEEDWTCLTAAWYELEPESGKQALWELLSSRSWYMAVPDAGDLEYLADRANFRFAIHTASGEAAWFSIVGFGDIWWNGTCWHSAEPEEDFRAACRALLETGVNMRGCPALTYGEGEDALEGIGVGSNTWNHTTRAGVKSSIYDEAAAYDAADWLDGSHPVLAAAGDVSLSFSCREPDSLSLSVFNSFGSAPAVSDGLRFTPYAGVNAYVLHARWDETPQGGWGSADYILLVDGSAPGDLPETEAGAKAALLAADAFGCSFTLENPDERDLVLYAPALFRMDRGGWEWMKPLRLPEDEGWVCPAGKTVRLGFDWSRALGAMEPGEYALLLRGAFRARRGQGEETVYIPLRFTLGENSLPEAPGPLSPLPEPEGLTLELTQLSAHRWVQTIAVETEDRYVPERDFTLFRAEADGSLSPVLPACRLSQQLNYPVTIGGEASRISLDVDLAAQYGVLQPGDYVARRRLFRLEEGEEWFRLDSPFDRSWRTLPEDRIVYADSRFHLSGYLAAPAMEVEPQSLPYTGEDPELPVSFRNGRYTSTEVRFTVKNPWDETLSFGRDEYALFYLDRNGEWLPLAQRRHPASGLLACEIPPGESLEWQDSFGGEWSKYAPLPQGTYRLVFSAQLGEEGEGGFIAAEFRIREDGTGMYLGANREAETLVRAYSSRLAKLYVWPEEGEDPSSPTGASPFTQDPYVQQWKLEHSGAMLTVTVYRDRDVERAKALLADYSMVKVVRGEDALPVIRPETEDDPGTLGILTAELVPQRDPELYREGTWLLTFTLTRDALLKPDCIQGVFPEVRDREEEQWRGLGASISSLEVYYPPEPVEKGTAIRVNVCLGTFHAEFAPEEEYRFVLAMDVGDREHELRYFTAPFAVTAEGEA